MYVGRVSLLNDCTLLGSFAARPNSPMKGDRGKDLWNGPGTSHACHKDYAFICEYLQSLQTTRYAEVSILLLNSKHE